MRDLFPEDVAVGDFTRDADDRMDIEATLASLPVIQREVWYLHVFGLSCQEIADIKGVTRMTINRYLASTRKLF